MGVALAALQPVLASQFGSEALAGILLVILAVFFVLESTTLAVIYLVAWFNYLVLLVSLLLTGGRPSYLSSEVFQPFYAEALAWEIVFWTTLGLLTLRVAPAPAAGLSRRFPLPDAQLAFTLLSVALLATEVAISFPRYFGGYTEDTDIGTPISEVGTILFSLVLLSRTTLLPERRARILIEGVAVLLILFIAAGSGKRLALSFVAVALVANLRSKKLAFLAYACFVLIGYVHGIVRDSLQVGGFALASLVDSIFFTNQGGSLHASAVYLRLVEEGVFGFWDRTLSLISTAIGALALPVSALPPVTQLNVAAMEYYPVQGNGGLVGAYSTVYLGPLGPVIFAAALASLSRSKRRIAALVFGIAVLATIRWTLYNVAPLMRLVSYVLVLVYLVYLVLAVANRARRPAPAT